MPREAVRFPLEITTDRTARPLTTEETLSLFARTGAPEEKAATRIRESAEAQCLAGTSAGHRATYDMSSVLAGLCAGNNIVCIRATPFCIFVAICIMPQGNL